MICEAYGPQLPGSCFFRAHGPCEDAAQCAARMAGERARLFELIQSRAADGDETFRYLAEQFRSPDELLGGPGSDDAQERPT